MESRCIRPCSDDVAGGIDPGGRGPGGPREVDRREGTAAADESMLDAGGVEVVAHHLSGIVDADDLSPTGAREVYVAEGAAIVRKAVQHARQVKVHPDDQTSPIDARSDA